MSDERTPLLWSAFGNNTAEVERQGNLHDQFCALIGTRPLNGPPNQEHNPHPESLYSRAVRHHRMQNFMYMFSASLSNTLILSQIVLGAALTGLGASDSSPVLVTIFGALNTVIAGVIAFLKSRGQPMRARMFRDDLARVVDEIENSAIMWLGISRRDHGYDAIDTDDQVTVRGEVARLTRLYDKAVATNTMNDPDNYSSGGPGDGHSAALRDKSSTVAAIPDTAPVPTEAAAGAPTSAAAPVQAAPDPDASPATKPPEPTKSEDPPVTNKEPDTKSSETKDQTAPENETASKGDEASIVQPVDKATASTSTISKSTQQSPLAASVTAAPLNPDESPASSATIGKPK